MRAHPKTPSNTVRIKTVNNNKLSTESIEDPHSKLPHTPEFDIEEEIDELQVEDWIKSSLPKMFVSKVVKLQKIISQIQTSTLGMHKEIYWAP